MQYYIAEFERKHGKKPLITRGKDWSLLADILRQLGPETTRELVQKFLASDDEFVKKAGHSIGVFHALSNKLLSANGHVKPGRSVNDLWAGRAGGEVKI